MARADNLLRRLAGRAALPDPLATLELQCRLSRLATEVRTLERAGPREIATAHHLQAALWAYDRTLEDALALMRLPVPDGRGAVTRLLAEATLHGAGWAW